MQRSDWEADISAAQKAEQAAYERAQQQAKLQSEEATRLEGLNQKLKDEAAWNRLMRKASLIDSVGQFGAGGTSADDYLLNRLKK